MTDQVRRAEGNALRQVRRLGLVPLGVATVVDIHPQGGVRLTITVSVEGGDPMEFVGRADAYVV